jgi:hypothetical protein
MAIMEQDPTVLSTKPFMDATEIQSLKAMPISFPEQSPLTLDSQGNPLLRGSIRNDDTISRWVSCIVALQYQDQLISLSRLVPAIPLTSGENRAFGLSHFPGWRSQFREHGIGLDEIHVAFYCDPLASVEYKGQILTLNSEVTGFEATGSSLIIRGEVYNHISQALPHVVVQADLRAIDGSIHASNFILVEEPIEIAGSSTFVLPVRLPAGTILPELEMDIRAIALLDNNVLPYE